MAACVFVAFVYLSWSGPLDARAEAAVDAGLKRALVTFGIARGLNGVISVAQGTEFDLSPGGFGVTLAPGEILDPVNDLIERFSWLMLMTSVALAIERVLIEVSGWWPISVAVMGFVGLGLWSWVRPLPALGRHARWVRGVAVVLVALRFAIPVTAIGSELFYGQFLAERHVRSEAGLADASRQVEALNRRDQVQGADERGLLERLGDWGDAAKRRFSVERYADAVEDAIQDTVELSVVFLLHTVVLPLLLVFAIWQFARAGVRAVTD